MRPRLVAFGMVVALALASTAAAEEATDEAPRPLPTSGRLEDAGEEVDVSGAESLDANLSLEGAGLEDPGVVVDDDGIDPRAAAVLDEEPAAPERVPPWLWVRQAVAVAGWPSGLISDSRVQARIPLYRSNSIVFRETYGGAGARMAVTPAYFDIGPRFSLAPIDIFDVDVQGGYIALWPSGSGLIPFGDLTESKLETERNRRHREDIARAEWGSMLYLTVAPTLKLKLGPIVAFDAWAFTWSRTTPASGQTAPLFYEPYRDMVLAREDFMWEHQAVVLYEVLDGVDGSLLWIGATFRDRKAMESGDRSMTLGLFALFKLRPDDARFPQAVVQVLPYLRDNDRVGQPPNVAFLLAWVLDHPLGAK